MVKMAKKLDIKKKVKIDTKDLFYKSIKKKVKNGTTKKEK